MPGFKLNRVKKKIRLQVFLAMCGVSSRRNAEILIKQKRVRVNDENICEPFYLVEPSQDTVTLDNKRILPRAYAYILLNKPRGIITTKSDPHAPRTVIDILPRRYKHLNPVGRLDRDTEGLLLLTNDGEIAFRMTHPKFNINKVYTVCLDKPAHRRDVLALKRGLLLDDGKASCKDVKVVTSSVLEITIKEGRKRQIRRMFASLGYRVIKLVRIREANLSLGNLAEGKYRELNSKELSKLYKILSLLR